MKRRSEIKHEIGDEIIKFQSYKRVFKLGNSGAVQIPRKLIGREVFVELIGEAE